MDHTALSKAVSHALRHAPWLYEFELDEAGWTDVEALLSVLRRERPVWKALDADDLAVMIARSAKQRHEIANGRIRALYGHSLSGKLAKTAAVPPERLYHGTAPDSVPAIRQDGLQPMARQYVHLSVDQTMALEVGRRKAGQPTILTIRSLAAHRSGIRFYIGNDKVWLTDRVPSAYIEV